MRLTCLKAINFRNFSTLNLYPTPSFNLIYGDNGSGKTSILEAIYHLSLARSFRTHLGNRVISYEQPCFSVFGTVENNDFSYSIGIEKSQTAKTRIKIGDERVVSAAELARIIPLQLINPDSYQLLTAGPSVRRQFMDWGTFHVEQSFFSVWQRFKRTLKQRNIALQQQVSHAQIKAWDKEFVKNAKELAFLRGEYVKKLSLIVKTFFSDLIEIDGLTIDYYQGWNAQDELQNVLSVNIFKDIQKGYTQFGPQKADLLIRVNNVPIEDMLSRGEQKLLVLALSLAQGYLLKKLMNKSCIYLIDDLAAELDTEHRKMVIKSLVELEAQVFITVIETAVLSELLTNLPIKMFHVKHGRIEAD